MNKGELMKLVYADFELRKGIDTAIPKQYWDGVDKDIQVDDTYYFVMNYDVPVYDEDANVKHVLTHGVLQDMREVAAERGIDLETGILSKTTILARANGYANNTSFMRDNIFASVVPGICSNDDCDYTTDIEPDQNKGFCEICHSKTVKSLLILEGVI